MSQKPHFAASDELQLCAAPPLNLFGGLLSTGGTGGVQKPGFEFQSDGDSHSKLNSSKLKVSLRERKALCLHTSFIFSLRKMKGSSHLHISLENFALRLLHRMMALAVMSVCGSSQSSPQGSVCRLCCCFLLVIPLRPLQAPMKVKHRPRSASDYRK